ncbi:hypothetical protein JQC72_06625 [Polycladomyces sp. WAk]|uniref:Uncharacterized protein n=1 Tax=Polycladomyces zharkentensis TaxID=2807616 RepID=A0ABS2WI46_9BACL|nr:hypothetical protein [Polycladomyces sp. WAk]MBN2909196.1 hypothetical protein [Polycladomyces sp. WAk]
MLNPNYRQYQFNLPSSDLIDFVENLAKALGLPYDFDDLHSRWFKRDQNHVYIVRDKKKDPNTFILVEFNEEWEFDDLVVRFRDENTEIVENIIRKLWKDGDISWYTGREEPRFHNVINEPENDWVPSTAKKYGLDIEPLSS